MPSKKLFVRLAIIVITFYLLVFIFSRIFNIGLTQVQEFVNSFGIFGPIVYSCVLLLGLTVPFNPVSDFLVVNVAAILFPPHVSIIFTFITHSLALTINYHLGKKYGGVIIRKIITQKNTPYVEKLLKKLTYRNIFILRLFLPTSNIVGVEVISYASGHEKIPFTKFFLVSIIPWTFLSVLYFTSTYFLRERSLSLYFLPAIIIILLPLLILFILRRNKGKKV